MKDNKTPPKQDYLQEIIQEIILDEQPTTRPRITLPVKIALVISFFILLGIGAFLLFQLISSRSNNQQFQKPILEPRISKEGDLVLKKEKINIDKVESIPEEMEEATDAASNDICAKALLLFKDQKLVKTTYSPHILFKNVHKKMNDTVYRLRFFYKDGDNRNVPTYLVYQEDKDGNEYIVESTPLKKGKLYTRIEKNKGEILYDSEAYEIKDKNDLFIRYENGEVKELQGQLDIEAQERFPLDCIY